MSDLLPLYDSTAADTVLDHDARKAVIDRLLAARTALGNDASGSPEPGAFEPLDADFVDWPARLLEDEAELSRIERIGAGHHRQHARHIFDFVRHRPDNVVRHFEAHATGVRH